MPVGAAEEEADAVLRLPLVDLVVDGPPRVPVDVLDAADVVDGVHEQADVDGLSVDVAHERPLVLGGVNGVERVEELHVREGGVVAAHRHGVGVGRGRVGVGKLVRIVHREALE